MCNDLILFLTTPIPLMMSQIDHMTLQESNVTIETCDVTGGSHDVINASHDVTTILTNHWMHSTSVQPHDRLIQVRF